MLLVSKLLIAVLAVALCALLRGRLVAARLDLHSAGAKGAAAPAAQDLRVLRADYGDAPRAADVEYASVTHLGCCMCVLRMDFVCEKVDAVGLCSERCLVFLRSDGGS